MDTNKFPVIFFHEYKLRKTARNINSAFSEGSIPFAQHKGGSIGFGKVTKGLMTLNIQEGSDHSMTTLTEKLWR